MIPPPEPIRVLLADDSAEVRRLLGSIIDRQPDMRVVGTAEHAAAAVEGVGRHLPDVVVLDVEMAWVDGVELIPQLLRARAGVTVIIASSLTPRGAEATLRALELGAADYIATPVARDDARVAVELVAKVRELGRGGGRVRARADVRPSRPLAGGGGAPHVVAVAASTGGPNALARLLSLLPPAFPLPIVVVQHMPGLFTAALAERLRRETGRPCREAEHGEPILPGRTYLAPGDFHLTVVGGERQALICLDRGAPVNFCRPAADPMLQSVARVFGAGTLALVLTGMGEDGLRGCREVVRQGGCVLVQDEASSVVWGMPGAVHRAGLATAALPIPDLAARVAQLAAAGSPA